MEPSQSPPDKASSDEKAKAAAQNRVRRRNRMITSCLECRRRKLKCDKLHPCTNCSKFSRECLFLAPALDSVSQQRLNEIKEKMGSLERVLEQDVARKEGRHISSSQSRSERRTSSDLPGGESSSSDNEAAVPEDEKGLEPTPLAVIDAYYEDDANDDILDLGVRIGKMRLTERLGGFFRPRIHEELGVTLRESNDTSRRASDDSQSPLPPLPDHGASDFLAPGPSFIAPGSGFLFGDVGNKRSLINYLPAKGVADILIRKYFENVHFIAKVVHWPSFQLQYDNFWTSVLAGLEPPAWQQAIVLSVLFAAVVSMSDQDVYSIFARPKAQIMENLQMGTEVALSKAQFLRATKLETLQALVIYMTPMCRDVISRAHSVLVGMAVRLAECMGLHRDPEGVYNSSPVECHVRRCVWFQLCFLDFRTCEGQGPRPGIKREDYDTKFPANIDDADLLLANPRESKSRWTDMTMSRLRFECTEMQRVIWFDRLRIEKKRASLTHILSKIETFRKAMDAKYNPIINPDVPIQRYGQLVMNVMIRRLYIMVLHRYMNNASNRVPERLADLTIQSGLLSMESAIAIEREPELSKWKWYSGAYQQWHIAFLLITIIYSTPTVPNVDRIWNVIDFVFEPDTSLSRTQKARMIITAIKDRSAVYYDLRRMRIPLSMKDNLAAYAPRAPAEPTQVDSQLKSQLGDAFRLVQLPPMTTGSGAEAPYASDQSWSFDTPATMLVQRKYLPADPGEFPGLTSSAYRGDQLPPQPQPVTQQQSPGRAEVNQTSPGQQIDFNSPSDSGTNESWPPLIGTDQLSWRTVLDQAKTTSPPVPSAVAAHGIAPKQALPQGGGMYGFAPAFSNENLNIPQIQNAGSRGDSVMLDIDWAEWDQLFPLDNSGSLDHPQDFAMGRPI